MSYNVNNIIDINLILTPSGLSAADFSTCFCFATAADLASGVTFAADTYRDYDSTSAVAEDFETTSDTYLQAVRWFSQIPSPRQFSVYMWDDGADSLTDVANKSVDAAYRFFYFFPFDQTSAESTAIEIANFADANKRVCPIYLTDADTIDPLVTSDVASVLAAKGARYTYIVYQDATIVAGDAGQKYAGTQVAACFKKFDPLGSRTAITAEYQVCSGITGVDYGATAYNSLKAKLAGFFTKIELNGSVDASRFINSRTTSSYGEFLDDVINLTVLENYVQVNGYNYIANAGTKRALTPSGYAGFLNEIESTLKVFYNNGVLGERQYVDLNTGETKIAKYGFVILSKPEDVFSLSSAERNDRKFPSTTIRVFLAGAAHSAVINLNVE